MSVFLLVVDEKRRCHTTFAARQPEGGQKTLPNPPDPSLGRKGLKASLKAPPPSLGGVKAPNGGRGERKERRIPFLRFLQAPYLRPSLLVFQCLKASKRGVSYEDRG
jgi:hypothetical protein